MTWGSSDDSGWAHGGRGSHGRSRDALEGAAAVAWQVGATGVVLGVVGLLVCGGLSGLASAAPTAGAGHSPLRTRTVLDGTALGVTGPDDLAQLGSDLFVSFQNGVPSTGGTPRAAAQSTIVEFTPAGRSSTGGS